MNLVPPRLKFWAVERMADILRESLPEHVLGRLSGIGEPPKFSSKVDLRGIQAAFESARVGETYYLFALFRDMIENDSHIQAEIGKRLMSFIGQQQTIEPYDKSNPEDVRAAEMVKDMIEHCDNWREGSLHLAGGHIWPVAGAEKIYAPVDGSEQWKWKHPVKYRLAKLHPIPYALFSYKVAYWNVNNTGYRPGSGPTPMPVLTNTGAIPIQDTMNHSALNTAGMELADPSALIWNPDDWEADLRFYGVMENGLIDWSMANCYKADPKRHVIHRANVATAGMKDNYGGTMAGLIPWWFFGVQGRDWFARAMERYASPFAVAYANTSNKNIFDLLAKAFNQATKVNALIVPPQAKIELKEVMVSGMADGYAKFIDVCNTEKTKAILGQTLSTTPKGTGMGSGVADLQGEVRSEWRMYDESSYAAMECKQIFGPWLRINGCKGRVRSQRGGLTPANQSLLARTFRDLSSTGWVPAEEAEEDMSKKFATKMRFIPEMVVPPKPEPARKSGEE